MAFCWKLDGNMKAVLSGLLLFLFVLTEAQHNCIYMQNMEFEKKYYAYNPNYPNNIEGPLDCKWQVTNPEPINVKVDCNISIPTNTACEQGSLSVECLNKKAKLYCGVGTIMIEGINPTIIFKLSSSEQKGQFMCSLQEKFDENNCRCGYTKKTTKIVGGEETGVNEFPMMAGLVDVPKRLLFCGATVISPRFVMTAAHCVENKNLSEIAVVVGEHDVTTGKETNATKLYPIIEIYTNDDLALCKIKGVIIYSPEVGPACLPFQHSCDSFGGAIVTALGWGLTEFGGTKSNVLLKVRVNVINPNECKQYYNNETNSKNMCTFTPGKDTCQMDSGGPVLWWNPTTKRFILVGLTSKAAGCGSDPAINVRVGAYLKWIVSIIGKFLCKVE